MPISFPYYQQLDSTDCGAACLRMVSAYHGKFYSAQELKNRSFADREGVSLKGIGIAAESIGLRTLALKLELEGKDNNAVGLDDIELPCIVHWDNNHFVVVYKISKDHVHIANPASGKSKLSKKEFSSFWKGNAEKGIALILEPTAEFFNAKKSKQSRRVGLSFLIPYFAQHKKLLFQLLIGLILGAVFQLIFPFLTQSIVDIGIQNQDLNFIYLILLAQLILFVGQISVNFIQAWILLHIGTRVNINLVTDFLSKLMRLPLSFFDKKNIGDLLQRIEDHERVEYFLTHSSLRVLFSFITIIVFGIALLIYSPLIFIVFLLGALLYVVWISIFLKKRRVVDQQRFLELSENQNSILEIIQGIQEIKLQGSEHKRRWRWTEIQSRLFKTSMKALSINQYQDLGAGFINQFKDILITFFAAKGVIDGDISIGMMLAIQYIVGYMNTPLVQLISFVRSAQDAKISLDRLNEIHFAPSENQHNSLFDIPKESDIRIENLHFKYNELSAEVLSDINLTIPHGKTTAIVGHSGSGKTSLAKLLLGIYEPIKGKIRIGGVSLSDLDKHTWRSACGAVMQDGYIFSDSIANNITESDQDIHTDKFIQSTQLAHVQEFVENFPLSYHTKVGLEGNNLSQGQKQRILIARAFYKDPKILIFDEATNALDASNEAAIIQNINTHFRGRTMIVIAHRLSTVMNADQIVVLNKGKIVEIGSHDELIENKEHYYRLVKDQIDLNKK